jgi:hypothetical protein
MIAFVLCYIALSLTLALLARGTVVGPVLVFLVSMFLTPLVAGIYVLVVRLENRNVIIRQP